MGVIDLSSPPRSNMAGAAAAAAMSQQQQQQQKRSNAAAAAAMTNGRSNTTITSTNNYRSTAAVLQQQLQQQQAAVVAAQQQAAAMSADGGTRHGNMIMLPEMTMGGTPYKPYEVVKKPIENKTIYCINKTPYRNTDYLMTIQDLKDVFFPYISLEVCRRVLNALDINLFVGNR